RQGQFSGHRARNLPGLRTDKHTSRIEPEVERSRRMSTETTAPPQAQQLASIFQKAYARAVALQRMDEQIGALLEQRQQLENEFREAQGEGNAECERMP